MSPYVLNRLPVGTHVDPGLWRESLSFRACVHRESPLGSVLVEPQDIERAVAARDLAIAVIGAEPLIEDFNDLDYATVQSESPRHGQTVGFAAVDLYAHAFPAVAPMIASLTESESHRHRVRKPQAWAVGFLIFQRCWEAFQYRDPSQACNSQWVSYYSMTRPSCAA